MDEFTVLYFRLNGLAKGDKITISQQSFAGGAVLFPIVMAEKQEQKEVPKVPESKKSDGVEDLLGMGDPESTSTTSETPVDKKEEEEEEEDEERQRYIVITTERLMILQLLSSQDLEEDEKGEETKNENEEEEEEDPNAPKGILLGNHHLTELIKLTYSKKNISLVTLFFRTGLENEPLARMRFLVKKRMQFVKLLQSNMNRFK